MWRFSPEWKSEGVIDGESDEDEDELSHMQCADPEFQFGYVDWGMALRTRDWKTREPNFDGNVSQPCLFRRLLIRYCFSNLYVD